VRRAVSGAFAAGLATLVASAAALAKEGQGGMPQLDYHLFAPQLVWLAIAFVALYLVMSRLAVPAISDTLDKRHAKIQGDLDAAEKANEEARSLIAAYQKRLADTREEARKLMRERGEADNAAAAARLQALHDRLAAQIAEAERRIAAQRDQVMEGLEQMAGDIGQEVYAKLAGQPADQGALAAKVAAAASQGTGRGGGR
jgi:F-type H+-transporting ATPase subunit b